ncbi:MAG: glycosyltransferase family 4 protein [Verrucomicrobia bacterium]|nr:glycosyltransferase family 4 protein [Verrucomicrobiota bacterium]
MALRVLFVNRMASMLRGGGETYDLEISRHLAGLGCEVSYLSGIPVFGRAVTPIQRERSFTLRTPYAASLPWDKFKGGWRLRAFDFLCFEYAAARWALKREAQFDIVQVCELPRFVNFWKKGGGAAPVVMRMTSPIYHDPVNGVAQADALIASGTTIDKIRGDVRDDCVNVPNGVDTGLFRPHESAFRKKHGIGADEIVVLYVARFAGVKRHLFLLKAFASALKTLPNMRLVLVGSGHDEPLSKTTAKELGISDRVLFLGEYPFDEVPDVYSSADIKVMASDYESFSFTTLEAMASGLPLVVTNTEWVPRLIGGDEGGRVTAIDDNDGFAEAILELAQNEDLRRKMGERNRQEAVQNYGWTASARKLLTLYEGMLGEKEG